MKRISGCRCNPLTHPSSRTRCACFVQVVCGEDTIAAVAAAAVEGRPLWRVSSTTFSQIASDEVLQPIGRFAVPESVGAYPPTAAGLYVQRELEAINLRVM